jgi:hypothetical protein
MMSEVGVATRGQHVAWQYSSFAMYPKNYSMNLARLPPWSSRSPRMEGSKGITVVADSGAIIHPWKGGVQKSSPHLDLAAIDM